MLSAVILLGAVAVGCVPAARLLAGADWPRRSPAVAIALWQALGLGWGVATVGVLAGFGATSFSAGAGAGAGTTAAGNGAAGASAGRPLGLPSVAAAAGRVARVLLRSGSAARRSWDIVTGLRILSLVAAIVLLALLCWILLAAAATVLRARHRQRALLCLLAHRDPKVPGALVVDHPAAAAYCVPGLRSAIVISAGALDLLDQAELAAVLAHEQAHLRARHDLVLLPFTALLRAFRWSATAREANREVALLVEMLADDRARRMRPARELATALLRVGASGGGYAPAGALAVTGASTADPWDRAGAADPTGAAGPAGAADPARGAGPGRDAGTGRTRTGSGRQRAARQDGSGELTARVARLLRPPRALSLPSVIGLSAVAGLLVIAPAAAVLLPL